MKVTLNYQGVVDVPFEVLKADPTLIVKKLPRVKTIELHGADGYYITSKPYYFHAALSVEGRGHLRLQVEADKISWIPCDDTHPNCNGHIEGTAVATADGKTLIQGDVVIDHPMINIITWAAMKNVIQRIGYQFMDEFVAHFKDSSFSNVIPAGE